MGWCVTKEGYGIKTQTITMVLGWVVCWCVVVSFFVLNLDGLEKKRDKQHVLSVVGVGGNEGIGTETNGRGWRNDGGVSNGLNGLMVQVPG